MLQQQKHSFRRAFKYNGFPNKVTIDKSGSNILALNEANKDLSKDKQIEVI